jgi:alkanesulfonate monooxygenase SsuD/methylene tetrahydromethanopterin reductase-like flavin-dependent oxidoreductase (luciferase family)
MKIDLFYEIDCPKPWDGPFPIGQKRAEEKAFFNTIDQVKLADTMGYGTAWFVEHHFREGRSHNPSPEVVLGALSQITENIRLGFGVLLVPHPFTHPVRVAEKVATVDLLSRGRVEWGTGRSTTMEQEAFHVPAEESRDMWRAAVNTIVNMWTQEYYEEHSKYLDFPRRPVTPRPYQYPHPPCWLACSSSSSYEMAGKAGVGALGVTILKPTIDLADDVKTYRNAIKNPDPLTKVINDQVGIFTLVHCVEKESDLDDDGTWESVWHWYKSHAEFILAWETDDQRRTREGKERGDSDFPYLKQRAEGKFEPREFAKHDNIIVGTPEQCMEKLERYEAIGADRILAFQQFGHLSQDSVLRSIELIGSEIIPRLDAKASSGVS